MTNPRHTGNEYHHLAPLFDQLAKQKADTTEHQEIRDRLITGHLALAEHIAQRFSGRGIAKDDLIQVATIGLINAVDRFDPSRGIDFLSYAVPTIMGEVRRHFRDSGWGVRVPRRLKELHLSINAASSEISQKIGRAPTASELAEHLDLSKDEIYEGLEAGHAYHSMSLDEMLFSDSDTDSAPSLGEKLGEEDTALIDVETHEALRPLMDELSDRERRVVALRFTYNLTQTQIAERLGISQMHVSRLLSRTLAALRSGLTEPDSETSGVI